MEDEQKPKWILQDGDSTYILTEDEAVLLFATLKAIRLEYHVKEMAELIGVVV